ncbi:MAG: glycosyltransferase family 39 protein [Thermoleophilaceae bacterium]|nr:glycosyltransferase family 39 protein [Thermoleophilaceae bacterium]
MAEPERFVERFAPALLALPFLIGIAVLRGLTVEIDTFHGSDAALYQLPTIMQLREGLDFSDYPSAQTPLFHLVMAGWGKLVGFELWKLRLLNVAISYGAALALLRLLRRTAALGPLPAFALTLAFALSPYFFGASFTLLTDNLAILFALLALERMHRYAQDGSPAAFATACLWIGAAVLTRQSFLWLVLVGGVFLVLRERRSAERLFAGAVMLALALAPLAALAIEWKGLVPPSADPASCGLCTDRPGFGRDTLTLRTAGFTVALLGLYAGLVFGPGLARRPGGAPRRPPWQLIGAGAAAGAALLLLSPLEYKPIGLAPGDAGYLWQLSKHLPTVLGSSLLFWVAVPTGAVGGALLARRAGWISLASAYLACFLAVALPVALVYQKYFDPFVLLAVALLARPPDFRVPWDYAGVALVCAGSVAYALSFAG